MEKQDNVTGRPGWAPDGVQLDKPSVARIYDCLLGGHHNFEADRTVVEKLLEHLPDLRLTAQANRGFLRRSVNFLLGEGIDQFLDIGSGIPTEGNVHELAQAANPAARVVYVDIDPTAVAHSQALLADNPHAIALQADARHAEGILNHPDVRRILDFGRPLGLLLVAVLHYVMEDQEAYSAVKKLRRALAPGSYLVIAHTALETHDEMPERAKLRQTFRRAQPIRARDRAAIQHFFGGFTLVEPGIVFAPTWRPEGPDDPLLDQPEAGQTLVGIGRKR
jgi:SAM-dependent methyltransferase